MSLCRSECGEEVDYLKCHVTHKCHLDSVEKLKNLSHYTIRTLLTEIQKNRSERLELSQKNKSCPEQVKILIDNVLLALCL